MSNESYSSNSEKADSRVEIGDVAGGIRSSLIAGRDAIQKVTNEITTVIVVDPVEHLRRRNRSIMLERVKRRWIEGVLEGSARGAALIELSKQERAEAVHRPWDPMLDARHRKRTTLPTVMHIPDLICEPGRALLILGAPGSGKTITLLELAREALYRAEQDADQPIPAVFNLPSWIGSKHSLVDWLEDELSIKYQIPRRVGREWIVNGDLLLLLDGLDEVNLERRSTCVVAINQFRRDYGFSGIVVCCRTKEYKALRTALEFDTAIFIQPLTMEQVDGYLTAAGPKLDALRTALRNDDALRELAQTPLMLSIMALTYRGLPAGVLSVRGDPEERRMRLFDAYVERMLQHRGADKRYSPEQTISWLAWLARKMSQNGQTEFFIEEIQPPWLPARAQRLLYDMGIRLSGGFAFLLAGLLAGGLALLLVMLALGGVPEGRDVGLIPGVLAFGLVSGLAYVLASLLAGRLPAGPGVVLGAGLTAVPAFLFIWPGDGLLALGAALIFGLPAGLAGASAADGEKIHIAETLRWSWKKALWVLPAVAVVAVTVWLVARILIEVLAVGIPVGVALILALGLTHSEVVETRTTPNQGVRRSARNAIRIGAMATLVILMMGISIGILDGNLGEGLAFASIFGLPIGLAAGLTVGGTACIQHMLLRLILRRERGIPWSLARFLDYATDRIFLRKVGGGYIFIHRLLLEYFASLKA